MLPHAAVAVCVVVVFGCGRGSAGAFDAESARQSLTTVLDAWKGGGHPEDLKNSEPEIFVNEIDWTQGRRLKDYQVKGEGTSDGRKLKVPVTLMLQLPARANLQKVEAMYSITVAPAIVVIREID
jgi:hypothetical protein